MTDENKWADWNTWEFHLAGDESEDLARVFNYVRPGDAEPERAAWARDWRTRTFCSLALHLLYENTIDLAEEGPIGCAGISWPALHEKELERHADRMIQNPQTVAALGEDRWRATWRARDEFMHDVLAYLFRPGPYARRIRAVQSRLIGIMRERPLLGEFIRKGVSLELRSNLNDPLVALQTSVQAMFPNHSDVRRHLQALDGNPLRLWAQLYSVVFPAYGLTLQPGKSWFELAYILTTVADGVLLRSRSHGDLEVLPGGDDVLSAVILGMTAELFGVSASDAEKLPVGTLPDESIDWLNI
jgi:hypothetical protein